MVCLGRQIESSELRFDKYLELTENNFKEIILASMPSVIDSGEKKRFLLKEVSVPAVGVFATFAAKVYDDEICNRKLVGKRVGSSSLANDWYLLTAAQNRGGWNQFFEKGFDALTGGYCGAAFWNPATHQVIIAHRGTKSMTDIVADVKCVYANQRSVHIDSAVTFTNRIVSVLKEVNAERNTNIQLYFTGHSLGGYDAAITTFSAKYCELNSDRGIFVALSDSGSSYDSSAVLFDPPGSKQMIDRIQDSLMERCNRALVDSLDVTTYLSSPNWINICHNHVGEMYRLPIEIPDCDRKKLYQSFQTMCLQHTLHFHDIEKITKFFDPTTNNDPNQSTDRHIQRIFDWPRLCNEKPHSSLLGALIASTMRVLLYGFGNYIRYFSGVFPEELRDFMDCLKEQEDYHVEEDELPARAVEGRSIRYRAKDVDEDYQNRRLITAFTDSELQFLNNYAFVRHHDKNLADSVFQGLDHDVKIKAVKMLKNYRIVEMTVYSSDMLEFIPFVKNLLHFYPMIKSKLDALNLVRNFKNSSRKFTTWKSKTDILSDMDSPMSDTVCSVISRALVIFCLITSSCSSFSYGIQQSMGLDKIHKNLVNRNCSFLDIDQSWNFTSFMDYFKDIECPGMMDLSTLISIKFDEIQKIIYQTLMNDEMIQTSGLSLFSENDQLIKQVKSCFLRGILNNLDKGIVENSMKTLQQQSDKAFGKFFDFSDSSDIPMLCKTIIAILTEKSIKMDNYLLQDGILNPATNGNASESEESAEDKSAENRSDVILQTNIHKTDLRNKMSVPRSERRNCSVISPLFNENRTKSKLRKLDKSSFIYSESYLNKKESRLCMSIRHLSPLGICQRCTFNFTWKNCSKSIKLGKIPLFKKTNLIEHTNLSRSIRNVHQKIDIFSFSCLNSINFFRWNFGADAFIDPVFETLYNSDPILDFEFQVDLMQYLVECLCNCKEARVEDRLMIHNSMRTENGFSSPSLGWLLPSSEMQQKLTKSDFFRKCAEVKVITYPEYESAYIPVGMFIGFQESWNQSIDKSSQAKGYRRLFIRGSYDNKLDNNCCYFL